MTFRTAPFAGLALACLCAVTLAAPAAAQTLPASPAAAPALPGPPTVTGPSKLAFINIQAAIAESAEGKKLRAAVEARFASKRTEIDNDGKVIASLQKQLENGGSTMSAAAKDDLNQKITSATRDYQQLGQNTQSDYQDALTDLLTTVGNKMEPIIKKYAEQHGYTAVVDTSLKWPQNPVLYSAAGADITGDIIRLYDQANPETGAGQP